MTDIELVVKIPEYMFEDIQDRYRHPNKGNGINLLEYAVAKGTPLPKGHGRLIDADELLKEKRCFEDFDGDTFNIIHEETVINADTIIEADIESGE